MTIWVVGGYGNGNVGDDMLGRLSSKAIQDRTGEPVRIVAGEYWPFGDRASNRRSVLFRSIRPDDRVVLSGGGLVNDEFGTGYLRYFASLCLVARFRRAKVHIVGVGVEHLTTRTGRLLARILFRTASTVTVRDRHSLTNAARVSGKARLGVDLGWLAYGEVSTEAPPHVGDNIVATIAVERAQNFGPRVDSLVAALQAAVAQTGAKVQLVAMQRSPIRELDDEVALEAVATRVGARCEIVRPTRHDEVRALLRGARLVVGYRLHASMLGAIEGLPVVAISRSPKVKEALTGVPGTTVISDSSPGADLSNAVLASYGRASTFGDQLVRELAMRAAGQLEVVL